MPSLDPALLEPSGSSLPHHNIAQAVQLSPQPIQTTDFLQLLSNSHNSLFRALGVFGKKMMERTSAAFRRRKVKDDNGVLSNASDAVATQSVKDTAADLLLKLADMPEWIQANEYIYRGYRAPSNSVLKSVRSILGVHNETINIWSHIIGCAIFLALPIYVFTTEIPPRYKIATYEDIIVCSTYFLGVAICFFLSASYHTISNHSPTYHSVSAQLDFLGILILMYSAMIPLIYYGFTCDHALRNTYWSLVSFLAALCAVATMHPFFHTPKARMWRGIFYSAFGASSFAPIIHGVAIYGWVEQNQRMGLVWWAYVALFNSIGVVAYAMKIPERYFPGKFDIVGQSHQIMHISVVVAGLMHVMGCLDDFDYLHAHPEQCL